MLPFFLQLLGFGNGVLGGGLCGELFSNRDTPLSLQGSPFWYALLFMVLLAVQLLYAAFVGLLGLLKDDDGEVLTRGLERGLYGLGIFIVASMAVLFVLTRSTGLPTPSAQGWVFGDPTSANPLALVIVLCSVAGAALLWQMRK